MRTLRILVVDDQEHMRELLVEALSADGHSVEPAENGMAAVKLFDTQPYDLVVSDLQMPQMDGRQMYRELRARGYEMPVMVVSAYGADRACDELRAQGALSKPFDTDVMINEVHQLLSARAVASLHD